MAGLEDPRLTASHRHTTVITTENSNHTRGGSLGGQQHSSRAAPALRNEPPHASRPKTDGTQSAASCARGPPRTGRPRSQSAGAHPTPKLCPLSPRTPFPSSEPLSVAPALCQPGHMAHHVTADLPPPAAGAHPPALQPVRPLPPAQPGVWREGHGAGLGLG